MAIGGEAFGKALQSNRFPGPGGARDHPVPIGLVEPQVLALASLDTSLGGIFAMPEDVRRGKERIG